MTSHVPVRTTSNSTAAKGAWVHDTVRRLDAKGLVLGTSIWLVAYITVIGLVLVGSIQEVPYRVYEGAGLRWVANQQLYDTRNIDGFQYFPSSAWIFSAFARLGRPGGGCTWRALSLALYVWGLWRSSKRISSVHPGACFVIATCASVAVVSRGLGNGQANLLLAALSLHVATDLSRQSWWRVCASLALGLAVKPLFVVLVLSVWAVYGQLWWRLPLVLGGVFGAPWCWRDPAWLARQFRDSWTKIIECSKPDRLFEDVRGLFATFGPTIPHDTYLWIRMIAAFGVLAVAWETRSRIREPFASFMVASVAMSYLMIFNPRTQSNSYVMTAPFVSLLGSRYVVRRRYAEAIVLFFIGMTWNLGDRWFTPFKYWLKPSSCILFLGMMLRELFTHTTNRWHFFSRGWPKSRHADRKACQVGLPPRPRFDR